MRAAILFLMFLFAWSSAWAQGIATYTTTQSDSGPVIEFTSGEFILTSGVTNPEAGWTPAPSPNIYRIHETGWRTGDFHTLVGRYRFDRSALGRDPLALYTVNTRNQFSVSVNGIELFRNYASPRDQILAWYRPYMVPIPNELIRPGENEIAVRAISEESVGIGRMAVGPNDDIQAYYRFQFFWQITAPTIANATMLVLGGLALLLWSVRRQEVELLWLALSTALWFLRNSQYFLEATPFHMATFNAVTVYATYFASAATCAFYACFLKIPHRNKIIAGIFALGVPLCAAVTIFSLTNLILYIPSTAMAFGVVLLSAAELRRNPSAEHLILASFMMLMPFIAVHDFLLSGGGKGWNGQDFYFAPFNGIIYSVAFLISFGKRALDAFDDLGLAKATLERRVAEARAELAASEEARQKLVVGQALAHERERLMQEMHDGVGSNLITALAVARQQQQPESTIRTLNRALADLKITVDSLEPIEGDLVALIGNFRHRMAGDLRDAGIVCKWEVQPCKSIPWLDAPNALHVLRIFQEAMGNALAHSGATELRIGCREAERDGVPGISAHIADNGRGFDATAVSTGKGLANIQARANSLHGALDFTSQPGNGATVTLWLPYARSSSSAPAQEV